MFKLNIPFHVQIKIKKKVKTGKLSECGGKTMNFHQGSKNTVLIEIGYMQKSFPTHIKLAYLHVVDLFVVSS